VNPIEQGSNPAGGIWRGLSNSPSLLLRKTALLVSEELINGLHCWWQKNLSTALMNVKVHGGIGLFLFNHSQPISQCVLLYLYKNAHWEFIIKMKTKTKDELLEWAWGLIANAFGGNWDEASKEWKKAAERWRDEYYKVI